MPERFKVTLTSTSKPYKIVKSQAETHNSKFFFFITFIITLYNKLNEKFIRLYTNTHDITPFDQ